MQYVAARLMVGFALFLPAVAHAQNRAVNDCRSNVAGALEISAFNVETLINPNGANGYPVIEWEVTLAGRRIRGFCETDRNGRVVTTQLGQFSRSGLSGGRGIGGKAGAGGTAGAVFSVNVDTSGRGTLTAMGQTVRITRGWVDTRSEPSVSLSGDRNFKITFYGTISGSGENREFTLRITRSDRGAASGTATIRLNPDRNEVEYIRVEGRVGDSLVDGTFNRD